MQHPGFDNDMYIRIQSEKIRERIGQFEGKLYMEFGGKLFDDYHASRVLPGFEPDSKLKMLLQMKDDAEVVLVINAEDIEHNKIRSDLEIEYAEDVLRLVESFRKEGLLVNSAVITRFHTSAPIQQFIRKLSRKKIKTYRHYTIEGYPNAVDHIVSEDGFGKNEYVETTRPLVIVTAPGPGSGKMATCLSQLYHENKRGIKAGYAKFETFPVWNLDLKHPVNLAYEAATADLDDVNMIDHFHLQAHEEIAVNYNRDIEIFPVLSSIFTSIYGESPYKSPTDMGVNMIKSCIIDDDVCCEAAKQEIIRRYYRASENLVRETGNEKEVSRIELLLRQAGIDTSYRPVVTPALERSRKEKMPAMAIELPDGRIITGGSSTLFGAVSAATLNALKALAGIDHEIHVIDPEAIKPIQTLKIEYLGSQNPALHIDETLIALSMSAASSKEALLAMQELPKLKGCQAHSTVLLAHTDIKNLHKLGIELTCEPVYENKAELVATAKKVQDETGKE